MCSLNKKCHLLFKLLHRIALAQLQVYLLFEVCLLSFPSNTGESVLTLWPFSLVLFASLSSRRFKFSSYNVANLDFNSAMTKLIKLLFSVLGDVTSACIKLLSVDMASLLHNIKSIVCRYDVRETEQARISCMLIASQNQAGDTNV